MTFPNCIGNKPYWTRERTIAGLRSAATELPHPLTCSSDNYAVLKKGRYDWPSAAVVLKYFKSMASGWIAAGIDRDEVTLNNIDWTAEEEHFVLQHAGEWTLQQIARKLRRSYGAVRRRLNELGIRARDNEGFMSAAQLSQEYGCPYHRIRAALETGSLPGTYDRVRNRWKIDLAELTPEHEALLRAPKDTWKTRQTDVGDYYARYGIHRSAVLA